MTRATFTVYWSLSRRETLFKFHPPIVPPLPKFPHAAIDLGWQCTFVSLGDEEEWDQQCIWHSELLSGLNKVDVSMVQLLQDQEKWTTQRGDGAKTLEATVWIMTLLSFYWKCREVPARSNFHFLFNLPVEGLLLSVSFGENSIVLWFLYLAILSNNCKIDFSTYVWGQFPACVYLDSRTECWDRESCGSSLIPNKQS